MLNIGQRPARIRLDMNNFCTIIFEQKYLDGTVSELIEDALFKRRQISKSAQFILLNIYDRFEMKYCGLIYVFAQRNFRNVRQSIFCEVDRQKRP